MIGFIQVFSLEDKEEMFLDELSYIKNDDDKENEL